CLLKWAMRRKKRPCKRTLTMTQTWRNLFLPSHRLMNGCWRLRVRCLLDMGLGRTPEALKSARKTKKSLMRQKRKSKNVPNITDPALMPWNHGHEGLVQLVYQNF